MAIFHQSPYLLSTPADAIANHCGLIVNKMEDPVYRQKYPNLGTLSLEVSPETSSSKAWWQCAWFRQSHL